MKWINVKDNKWKENGIFEISLTIKQKRNILVIEGGREGVWWFVVFLKGDRTTMFILYGFSTSSYERNDLFIREHHILYWSVPTQLQHLLYSYKQNIICFDFHENIIYRVLWYIFSSRFYLNNLLAYWKIH